MKYFLNLFFSTCSIWLIPMDRLSGMLLVAGGLMFTAYYSTWIVVLVGLLSVIMSSLMLR